MIRTDELIERARKAHQLTAEAQVRGRRNELLFVGFVIACVATMVVLAGCSEITDYPQRGCAPGIYNECVDAAFEPRPAACSELSSCDQAACLAASSASEYYATAEDTRACDEAQPACEALSPTWYVECSADCAHAASGCMAGADVCTGCAGKRNECLSRCTR